jgi:hypothetical protein
MLLVQFVYFEARHSGGFALGKSLALVDSAGRRPRLTERRYRAITSALAFWAKHYSDPWWGQHLLCMIAGPAILATGLANISNSDRCPYQESCLRRPVSCSDLVKIRVGNHNLKATLDRAKHLMDASLRSVLWAQSSMVENLQDWRASSEAFR